MRLSCNGCRVLRKGCSDSCSIRPCLQWIKSPDAQSNATVFLAKFYGRAGLLNLIDAAGPEHHLRQAAFRSLLYEACGRIVNPVYGSVGLLWSGNWHLCQAAVEAVLKGEPIVRISDDDAAAFAPTAHHPLPLPPHKANKAYVDIRHVVSHGNKKKRASPSSRSACCTSCDDDNRSKKKKPKHHQQDSSDDHPQHDDQLEASTTAAVSDHHHHLQYSDDDAEAAGSHVSQAEHNPPQQEVEDDHHRQQQNTPAAAAEEEEPDLDLTLGLAPPPTSADDGEGNSSSPAATGCTADAEPAFLGLRFL